MLAAFVFRCFVTERDLLTASYWSALEGLVVDVDRAFLLGAVGQLIPVIAFVFQYVTLSAAYWAILFSGVEYVEFYSAASVILYCIREASLLVFGLLLATTVVRLHNAYDGGIAGILGAVFASLAGSVGIVFEALAFRGVWPTITVGSVHLWAATISSGILTGLAMLFVGVYFVGYHENFSRGFSWKAAGLVYVFAGLFSFLMLSPSELVIAAFLIGAVCFLGERSGNGKRMH